MALITLNSFCRERREVNNERSVEHNWDLERIVFRIVRGEESKLGKVEYTRKRVR